LNVVFPSRKIVLGLLLLLSLFLTACGSSNGETWAGVVGDTDSGMLIVSFRDSVTSLKADHSRNWIYESDGAKFYAPALITDDTVYVGDFKGQLHAINKENGEARWVYKPDEENFLFFNVAPKDRILAGAEYADGTIFFGSELGVFALNAKDGKTLWTFKGTEHSIWARPLYIPGDQPMLIVGSLDKHMYALNPEDGELIWKTQLEGAIPGQPTYDAERQLLYIGTLNSHLYALNMQGEKVAEFKSEGWVWGGPAMVEDTLYFGDLAGYVYAVQMTDDGFKQIWKKEIAQEALRAKPVVVDNTLVIASEDMKIYGINIDDQSVKWTNDDLEIKLLTDLVFAEIDGKPAVVMGTDKQEPVAFAVSVADGKILWKYKYEKKDD
jgi:outer membrane protein assembly factor BamB